MAEVISNLTVDLNIKIKGLQRQLLGIKLIAFIARIFKIKCEVFVNNVKQGDK